MHSKFHNPLVSKVHAVILAVVLCFAVLGMQSIGLFHGMLHANQTQDAQSYAVFDEIEQAFSADPQKSNLVCKLLDSLLLGASAISGQGDLNLPSFSHATPLVVIQASFILLKVWLYQSQAPPQSLPR